MVGPTNFSMRVRTAGLAFESKEKTKILSFHSDYRQLYHGWKPLKTREVAPPPRICDLRPPTASWFHGLVVRQQHMWKEEPVAGTECWTECCMQAQLPRIPKWPVQRRNKIPKGKSKVSQKIQSEQKSYSFQSQGWKRQTTWQKWVLEILFGAVKITQSAKWLPNKQQDPSPGHKHHIQAGHEGSSQLHSKAGR